MQSISSAAQPRARILAVYASGWRRIWRAPAVTVGVLLTTWLVTPVLSTTLAGSFFGMVLQETAPVPTGWALQVAVQIQGFTFTPEFLAFAGLLPTVRGLAAGESLPLERFGAVAVYVGIWLFLTGGILDRLARDRPVRTAAFFAACGGLFLRMLRLGILAGAGYWVLFRWINPWLRGAPGGTNDVLVGTTLYVVGLAAFATVSMAADFAKVRTVVEDRRSVLGALAASIRFLGRRAGQAIALWLLHLLVVATFAAAWYYLASYPGARSWFDLLVVQLYVLVQLWAKLALLGAQVAFFQSELAHATYTAAPLPMWPDSPSVEAIENFLQRRNSEPPV